MTVLAFAVADAAGPPINANFYGFEADSITAGSIATIVIRATEPPLATNETLSAYHDLVNTVHEARACLPHRFGVVLEEASIEHDLQQNERSLVEALDTVRDRDEWRVRFRAESGDAARVAASHRSDQPPAGPPLEVGRWVHEAIASHLADVCATLIGRFEGDDHLLAPRFHDDRLGFDLDALVDRGQRDFSTIVERFCSDVSAYLDIDLFGPTPCYRFSARLLNVLTNA